MGDSVEEITTEELVVALLQEILANLLQNKERTVPIASLIANGALGQLPGVVDDTVIAGNLYRPDPREFQLEYHPSSGDVWVWAGDELQTIVPGGAIGNLGVLPGHSRVMPVEGEKELDGPPSGDVTPPSGAPISDLSAEELAKGILAQAS